jgi:alpha-galactosidase
MTPQTFSFVAFFFFLLPLFGERPPVKVFIMAGQSNMVGPGDNRYLKKKHQELLRPRDDVWCAYLGMPPGPLRPGYGFRSESFGPELLFGHVVGDAIEAPILILKYAYGGKTLHRDFRPPSAVKRAGGKVGHLYTGMMLQMAKWVSHLDVIHPAVKESGFELSGFVWFQGENDSCGRTKEDRIGFWNFYQNNLTDLVHDVRDELGVPDLPILIAQINDSGCWDGKNGELGGEEVRAAQRYVVEHTKNAATIVTCDLDPGYHYDSPSHVTIGQRMGAAMLPLTRNRKLNHRGSKAVDEFIARRLSSPPKLVANRNILMRDLVLYFQFEEGEGNSSRASIGGLKGKFKGKVSWQKGRIGRAVRLERDQWIDIHGFKEPFGPDGHIRKLTISYWIQTATRDGLQRVGKGVGYPFVPGKRDWMISAQANYAGWDLGNFDIDGFGFFTTVGTKGPRASFTSWGEPTIYRDGFDWRHLVAVFDADQKKHLLYMDNHLAKAKVEIEGEGIIPADVPLRIGGPLKIGGHHAYDELAIWSRALTPEEVALIYNNGHGSRIPLKH